MPDPVDLEPSTPVEPAVPTLTEPEPDLDPSAVDLKDENKVRGLLAELTRTRSLVRELKPKAEQADQLAAYVNEHRPTLEFLAANPDVLRRQTQPIQPHEPAPDPDALEAAQLMDFYTADGKPDVARGTKWLALQDKRSGKTIQQAVQPVEQQNLQQQTNENFYRVLQTPDAAGRKPSEVAVRAVFQQLVQTPEGLKITADPRMAPILYLWALGSDRMMSGQPPAIPPAPLQTEAGGGPSAPRGPISALEQKVMRDRGIKPEAWQAHTKAVQAGRPTVLEEE